MRRLFFLLAFLLAPVTARAHPHVWVEARAELVVDGQGRLVAIRHHWTFDEVFSSFAKQGLDANRDGRFSREELQGLAEVNVTSLADFGYFTAFRMGERDQPFDSPRDYWLDHDHASGQLTLNFTLPLRAPIGERNTPVTILVFDPEYFVAFEMAQTDPVKVAGGLGTCRFDLRLPRELDEQAAAELAQIPSSQRNLPPELADLTRGLANEITLTCP